MAYVTFSANGDELDRMELKKSIVIGRSPECDLSVRDILLSRRHCKIEPFRGGWRVTDLNSKNGIHSGWNKVRIHFLLDGDKLRIGRTMLAFSNGPFVAMPKKDKLVRPADPAEAMSGTISDFVYVERDEKSEDFDGTPSPQPEPAEPKSFTTENFDGMVSELVSSSWDSIVATATRPTRVRPMPRVAVITDGRRVLEVDLSLQAMPEASAAPATTRRRRSWHLALQIAGTIIVAAGVAAVVFLSGWLCAAARI